MEMKKSISILFVGFIVFSFLFLALPNKVQADEGEYISGCCQSFVEKEPGCLYPCSPDGCSGNMNGKFLEGEKCDIDTGFCSGYVEDGSTSSESGQ